MKLPTRLFAAVTLLALAGCSPKPPIDDGLAVHQSVALGTAQQRVEVLEDARITPAMRDAMWGGSKDPTTVLATLGGDMALAQTLAAAGFRRSVVRLLDQSGHVQDRRRLDCELGQIAEPALPQGNGVAWGVGDDCSTGEGDFAGLITRFLAASGTQLAFETYRDPATGEHGELTLVTANRIVWHLATKGRAEEIHEVSSHPDFDDPRFKNAGDHAPPADLPWVVDYLTFRWDGKAEWIKSVRTEKAAKWAADQAWPEDAKFPVAEAPL